MKRWYKYGKDLLREIVGSQPRRGEAYIWFAGQHGFIANLGGTVFYIDVLLNDLCDENGRSLRVYPPPFAPAEIQRVDYVLCTHNHIDHLNMETLLPLARANPKARFIVPAPHTRLLVQAGIAAERVLAARAGEPLVLDRRAPDEQDDPARVIPVPAFHTRYIQDESEKDSSGDCTALGFIIKADGLALYHSGDTWITPALVQTLKAHAPLDIAMLPINGTDWERTSEDCVGNAGYLDAVKLARAVPFDLVFPAHYDMMARNSENPARFADAMYALCPHKKFHVCALGERFIYRKD